MLKFGPIQIPAELSFSAIEAAGIPATFVKAGERRLAHLLPHATLDHMAELMTLIEAPPAPTLPGQEQMDLTDAWLSLKACLDSLPAIADPDPYEDARARLSSSVASALQAVDDAGGAG